jgi:NADH-quinone oxidoreductase subunit L
MNKPLYNFLLINGILMNFMMSFLLNPSKKLGLFLWKFCDGKLIDGFGPDGISSFIKKCSIKANKFQSGLFINMHL